MSRQVGQQLESYQITSLLGKGGMGEVFLARDTKLKRDVAIKVLPEVFARDPERVGRFQREAEALAALNHQNIAAIYDVQQSGETRFLVLELVEGDTLAEIVVQPFPEASGKWQVSTNGGIAPQWRADSKELYFIAPDGKFMAASVNAAGSTFEAGTPVALFPTRIMGGGSQSTNRPNYAVSKEGRFLVKQLLEEATSTPITLILNWNPDRKK